MSILDRLYRANAKDIASGSSNIRRYIETIVVAPTAAVGISVSSTVPVPPDTVRLIHSVSFVTVPGAAQSAITAFLQAFSDGTVTPTWVVAGVMYEIAAIATIVVKAVGGLEYLAFPGELFILGASFTGGAAANSATVHIHGFEFPRGTLQR